MVNKLWPYDRCVQDEKWATELFVVFGLLEVFWFARWFSTVSAKNIKVIEYCVYAIMQIDRGLSIHPRFFKVDARDDAAADAFYRDSLKNL